MSDTQTKAPAHRSHSQLNSLTRCGEAYRLERVENVPQRRSWAAVAGVVIHQATEVFDYEFNPAGTEQDLVHNVESALNAAYSIVESETTGFEVNPDEWRVFGKQDGEWYKTHGIPNAITNYAYWRWENRLGIRLLETPDFGPMIEWDFDINVGTVRVKGFVDRVFEDMLGPFALDLKSGKKPTSTEQLGLYSYALNEKLGLNITRGAFLYSMKAHPQDRYPMSYTGPLDLSVWTPDRLAQRYATADQMIRQNIFLANPGDACFACSVWTECEWKDATF